MVPIYYTMLPDGTTQPCDREVGLKWFEEDNTKRQVAKTTGEGWSVSTVFLVIDHSGYLFETMIFGGPNDGWSIRYKNRPEAEMGHQAVVKMLQSGGTPE